MKIVNKTKYSIIIAIILICNLNFAVKKQEETKDETKQFYSKYEESKNTNDGVIVNIIKSDKYGDYQDEFVAVDMHIENLNRYADLEINIEALPNDQFKIHGKNKKLTVNASEISDITFEYEFINPTIRFKEDTKKKNNRTDFKFGELDILSSKSNINEKYVRDREDSNIIKNEYTEIEKNEYDDTKTDEEHKKTIYIVATVLISIILSIFIIYLVRRYIKSKDEFYNIFFILSLSLIIILSSLYSKNTYAYEHQTFIINNLYNHTYVCEVWHGGIAYTFRYNVSYKYVGEIPIYENGQDSDGDGLTDNLEIYYLTDMFNIDTDGDNISDYEEIYIIDTDPLKKDTDENGINDGDEDYDKDGLTNIEEKNIGTYMNEIDTDDDNLTDYEEVKIYNTDPLKKDTDGDNISDYEEVMVAKKLGISDISSIDINTKIDQVLTRDNMDKQIYTNNTITFSISGTVPGLIENHVEVEYANNQSLKNLSSLIGPAMFIKSDYENEKLVVKFDCSNYKQRLDGLKIATLEKGKIKFLNTTLVENEISAEIDKGYIFVIDGIKYIDDIYTYKKDNYK